jgi:phosphoribosylanthranilate isomerase
MRQIQSRTRAKICGITRAQDIQAAVSAGADAIGLVFSLQVQGMSLLKMHRNLRISFLPMCNWWVYLSMQVHKKSKRCLIQFL